MEIELRRDPYRIAAIRKQGGERLRRPDYIFYDEFLKIWALFFTFNFMCGFFHL